MSITKIKTIFKSIILIIVVTLFSSGYYFAQTNDFLQVSVQPLVQDLSYPHEFNIEVQIKSTIDSDRLQLEMICPDTFLICTQDNNLYSIKASETKKFTLRAVPKAPGKINIIARAQIWQNDITYASSSSINIELDQNLEQVPQPEEYKKNKQNRDTLQTIGMIVVAILGIAGITYFAYLFRRWYNED